MKYRIIHDEIIEKSEICASFQLAFRISTLPSAINFCETRRQQIVSSVIF